MKNLKYRVRHVIKYILHLHAIVAIIGGIYRSSTADTKELGVMYMTQYILYAILFELIALNIQVARMNESMNGKDKKKGSKKKSSSD